MSEELKDIVMFGVLNLCLLYLLTGGFYTWSM